MAQQAHRSPPPLKGGGLQRAFCIDLSRIPEALVRSRTLQTALAMQNSLQRLPESPLACPLALAMALGGFSDSEGGEQLAAPAPLAAAAARPEAGSAALVQHAATLVHQVLDAWQAPGHDPEPHAEQLASVCFALQSSIGRGRLGGGNERALFDLAVALWDAALAALPASPALCTALEGMAGDLYALVEDSRWGWGGG